MSDIAYQSFIIPQGATWTQSLVWKTGAPPTGVNLNGFTGRMQLRENAGAPNVAVELTSGNGRITVGNNGSITLSLSAAETAAVPARRYVYDLEMVSSGGLVTRLLEGTVTISPGVTR
jgi:hypothetical protein